MRSANAKLVPLPGAIDECSGTSALPKMMRQLASFGHRRLQVLLRRDGIVVNIKRTQIYRTEFAGAQADKTSGRAGPRQSRASQLHHTLQSGRRIHTLNTVDDFTRECLAIEVDSSLSDHRVARAMRSPLCAVTRRPSSWITARN
jgi:putative transposase